MINFHDWLGEREWAEAFDRETISQFKILDGVWEPPLEDDATYHRFHFNLPSDPNKNCYDDYTQKNMPCYFVGITNAGGISFGHKESMFGDRHDANKDLGGMKTSTEMMNSVLQAIGEYVEKKNPEMLRWSAVQKSRSGAQNLDAREKIYFMWAAKNIFPSYVPISSQMWIRADMYKQNYRPEDGYPELPLKGGLGAAKQFLAQVQQGPTDLTNRRREEEERAEQERFMQMLNDPQRNPQQIQSGDTVTWRGKEYQVVYLYIDPSVPSGIQAAIQQPDERASSYPAIPAVVDVRELQKGRPRLHQRAGARLSQFGQKLQQRNPLAKRNQQEEIPWAQVVGGPNDLPPPPPPPQGWDVI